jgi:translation initiation factor 1
MAKKQPTRRAADRAADRIDPAPAAPLSSLGDLLRARGVAMTAAHPSAAAAPGAPRTEPGALQLANAGKIVVRRERKGHGGKTVTVIDGLNLPPGQLEAAARELRKQLGCGSWVDAGRIVLQGDLAGGAAAWLRARGATRIVEGS